MATYYYDSAAGGGGDGSIGTPYNDFSAIQAGSHTHLLKRGSTFVTTFTVPAASSNSIISAYDSGALPIIDCGDGTITSGIFNNSQTGIEISYIRFVNQNTAAPQGAVRLNASGHNVHHCEFDNNRSGIHLNNCTGSTIANNTFDIGNVLTQTEGWGIRLNGTSTGNTIEDNTVNGTSRATSSDYGSGIWLFGGPSGNTIRRNLLTPTYSDGILLDGADSNTIEANILDGDLFDMIALEDSDSNTVIQNTVIQQGGAGSSFPCLKLGNSFGSGSPSGLNVIKNNIFKSAESLCVSNLNGGTTNTMDGNLYYRTVSGTPSSTLVRYDYFGGPTDNFRTLAQWQSDGYEASGLNDDPDLTTYVPSSTSPVVGAGLSITVGLAYNSILRPSPPAIGALEPVVARIYAIVYDSALGDPSDAQIVSGVSVDSATAVDSAVIDYVTAGTYTMPDFDSLTAASSYKTAAVWFDGTNYSNVVVTTGAWLTALTGGGWLPHPMRRRRR